MWGMVGDGGCGGSRKEPPREVQNPHENDEGGTHVHTLRARLESTEPKLAIG